MLNIRLRFGKQFSCQVILNGAERSEEPRGMSLRHPVLSDNHSQFDGVFAALPMNRSPNKVILNGAARNESRSEEPVEGNLGAFSEVTGLPHLRPRLSRCARLFDSVSPPPSPTATLRSE